MLHLAKLAVGARDVADLREFQAERIKNRPPLRHRTRHFPRRSAEVVDGGSIYWVVAGAMIVRQRIVDIVNDKHDDGSACAALVLDPALVAVAGRLMRPFQGWRYLQPEDAPPDLARMPRGAGEAALPPAMRRELRALGLI
jgi:hypothetical protein